MAFDSQFLINTFLILRKLLSLYYCKYYEENRKRCLQSDNKDYEFMMNEKICYQHNVNIFFMININEYIHGIYGNFNILQYNKYEKLSIIIYFVYYFNLYTITINNRKLYYLH